MYLQTDEQTIDDLRLFGKRDSSGVYDLYNHAHTRGGENLLRELFRNPLADQAAINQRSNIIQHFAQAGTVFPYNGSMFDIAEKYLHADEQSKQQGHKGSISEKEIANGVAAVIEMIQRTKVFIESKDAASIAAYAAERAAMAVLLADPAFAPVLREQGKTKLPYTAVAAYDVLFRSQERNKIGKMLDHIYFLDVYLSVAKVAVQRKFVFPKALHKGSAVLKLEGVYHPELKEPVSNDMWMDGSRSLIFLTGANMAGKSTFLRSVSIAMYVAHMGFPVAAKSMEFSVLDGLYTTINLPDNLGIGASHFYAEVLRVKQVATELSKGKSLFIVFDELFRGTNVKDAHEASVAIALAFAKKKNSLFIISSHIIEAGDQLKQLKNIGFQFLPTKMNGHTPEYTYKLEQGITDDRHGMIIIRNEGILETLKNGRKRAPVKDLR